MSDNKKDQSDINEYMEKTMANDAELERLKDEVALKKAKIDQSKYTQQLEQLEQDKKDLEIAQKIDYGKLTDEQIEQKQSDFLKYMKGARRKLKFITPELSQFVPFFRSNLILIGAHTGRGKSTAAANIAYSILTQKNEDTGG